MFSSRDPSMGPSDALGGAKLPGRPSLATRLKEWFSGDVRDEKKRNALIGVFKEKSDEALRVLIDKSKQFDRVKDLLSVKVPAYMAARSAGVGGGGSRVLQTEIWTAMKEYRNLGQMLDRVELAYQFNSSIVQQLELVAPVPGLSTRERTGALGFVQKLFAKEQVADEMTRELLSMSDSLVYETSANEAAQAMFKDALREFGGGASSPISQRDSAFDAKLKSALG